MTATKRPWFWEPVEPLFAKRSLAARIWSASGVLIAETESAIIGSSGCETHGANAALIVRAVNHHEELMEIARAVKRFDSFTACGEVEAVSKEARSLLDRIEKGGE